MLQFCQGGSGLDRGDLSRRLAQFLYPGRLRADRLPDTSPAPRPTADACDCLPLRRFPPLPGGSMPEVDPAVETPPQTGFDGMLARAAAKDRTHIQRHLAAADLEADGAHAALWRRLATSLFNLAPLPIQTVGHSAVLFFTPDGKYRMQMFALEDQNDGKLAVYLPDVLNDAVKTKILKKADTDDDYAIVGSMRNLLHVEALDSQNTPEPPNHVKNMLGCGRKALRVTLPTVASNGPRVEATEAMLTLAAKQRAAAIQPKPAPAAAKPVVAKPVAEKPAVEKPVVEKPAKAAPAKSTRETKPTSPA